MSLLLFFQLGLAVLLHAQFALGPKIYTRLTDDRVGPTQGFGIHLVGIDYDSGAIHGIGGGGFDVSIPQHFNGGTATIDAWDSATLPYTITRTINQTVTDYALFVNFGLAINPKNKENAWIATFGLRGIYRNIKIDYSQPWDQSVYSRYSVDANPRIPAALNINWNIGCGYFYRYKWLGIYPQATFCFGSNDWNNKHPWNFYPNHLELSVTIFAITKLGA